MRNLTSKKLDSKKVSKMCGLFEELYSDKTPYVNGLYVQKAEEFLTLFFEIFIKPDFEGLAPMLPAFDSWDKSKEIELTGEMWFGEITLIDELVVNSGVLFFANTVFEDLEKEKKTCSNPKQYQAKVEKAQNEFFEFRNELLTRLIDTVAHECRHGIQKQYLNLLLSPTKNKAKIQLLETKLGKICEEIRKEESAESFADTSEKDYLDNELLSEFAHNVGLISHKQYQEYQQEMLYNDTAYQIIPIEKDARKHANIKMWQLAKVLRNYQKIVSSHMQDGFIKQDIREKFCKLSNARAEFFYIVSEQIVDEIEVASREKKVKTIQNEIACKLTPDHIAKAAKKYSEDYVKHSRAEAAFYDFICSLLRRQELKPFFENQENIVTMVSKLKELNFPSVANLLETLDSHSEQTY